MTGREAIITLAALWLGSGCATGPDAAFLEVGGEYAFTAAILRSYDCDPTLTAPRDDVRCGPSSGVVTVGFDTVAADFVLDTYLPTQVCDSDGCRDDPTHGRFTGTGSVRIVQCPGADGTGCDEDPPAPYDVAVTHATVDCIGDRLPVVCTGSEGGSVVSVGVEIPGVLWALFGVPDGREIRGHDSNLVSGDRDLVAVEWVLR
jgi:hypothetical protein